MQPRAVALLALAAVAGAVGARAAGSAIYSDPAENLAAGATLNDPIPAVPNCFVFNGANPLTVGYLVSPGGVDVCCQFRGLAMGGLCAATVNCDVKTSAAYAVDGNGICLFADACYAFDGGFNQLGFPLVVGPFVSFPAVQYKNVNDRVDTLYSFNTLKRATDPNIAAAWRVIAIDDAEYACTTRGVAVPLAQDRNGAPPTACQKSFCSIGSFTDVLTSFLYSDTLDECFFNCAQICSAADTENDPSNCGGCNSVCSSEGITVPTCSGGLCDGVCDDGAADCNSDKLTDGCETDIAGDINNCGACFDSCSSNNVSPTCDDGVCMGTCEDGFDDCVNGLRDDGCETNTNNDLSNCGGCGIDCSQNNLLGVVCDNGSCEGTCSPGTSNCDGDLQGNGCETETDSDVDNCGSCSNSCNTIALTTCNGGSCGEPCAVGFGNCDNDLSNGCESGLGESLANCGSCGQACSADGLQTNECANGECEGTCLENFLDCNNDLRNDGCESFIFSDEACGDCNTVCDTTTSFCDIDEDGNLACTSFNRRRGPSAKFLELKARALRQATR